ncbi:MAG: hypothetical protein HN842_01220 [Gammaproteobacteria bacterium]|jgi:cell division GTPase FtsZ|nr:hypothetical protein [Gammaproteobacteria bacterium]
MPSEIDEATNIQQQIHNEMEKHGLRPGANITVVGVGGAGRNAIRNMRALGIDQMANLVTIDTDRGSDRERYPNRKKRADESQ